jgi:DNA-binding NarL/FixJ family response regulator
VAHVPKILFHDRGNAHADVARRLAADGRCAVCRVCDEGADLLDVVGDQRPDLVVLGLELAAGRGVSPIRRLQEQYPGIAVVVVTEHDQPFLAERVLRSGAKGYVTGPDSSEETLSAIHAVLEGRMFVSSHLSLRLLRRLVTDDHDEPQRLLDRLNDLEFEVYALLRRGRARAAIEAGLGLSSEMLDAVLSSLRGKRALVNFEIDSEFD